MLKHFVEFLLPGAFVSETSEKEIPSRSTDHVLPINKDSYAYAFRFFDRNETETDGEILKGKNKNYSGTYFLGGEKYSLEDVQKMEKPGMLASNMKINEWEHVVKTKYGNFQPLEKGDMVIEL